MANLNLYASRIYGEHPLAIWPLDIRNGTDSPRYTDADLPAYVSEDCTQGVPLVYGSVQSIRLYPEEGMDEIIIQQERTWENVKNDPDTLAEEKWSYWKNKAGTGESGQFIVKDWLTEDYLVQEGLGGGASIIYDSFGMFTNEGKYNTYTAEFWIRIDPRLTESKKIWGTIDTFDGLWVNDNYITLVVGKTNKSYAIENWYRPMIVAVTYTPTQARLVINGQEVIVLDYAPDDLEFTSMLQEEDKIPDGENKLGFIAHNNINLYEVDCFSLYSYVVPDDVLKRRFVWGQGVKDVSSFSGAYETQTTYIDYPFAEYTRNVMYPDLLRWDSGYLDNLMTDKEILQTPEYQLPEIFVDGRSQNSLMLENHFRQIEDEEPFFSFKPEYDWDQVSFFKFKDINKLTTPVQTIYGVFKRDPLMDDGTKQPLMVFEKEFGNKRVEISITGTTVSYSYEGAEFSTLTTVDGEEETIFTVGFDINKLLSSNNPDLIPVKNFFSNLSDISLFVGGDGVSTFDGFIYTVGIADTSCVSRNSLQSNFNSDGIAMRTGLEDTIVSYTLKPFVKYGKYYLDVATDAYWEDGIALEALGKNFLTEDGYVSKLDFFQLNIGYDGPYKLGSTYDTEGAELKSYIAFHPLNALETDPPLRDLNIVGNSLKPNRVIEPGADWRGQAYEFINGTVVYPPTDVPYEELKVNVYFKVKANGIIASPFKVKNFSIASQAAEPLPYPIVGDPNVIAGTRYGSKLRSEGAFAIYKESTPYLYLSKDSGVEPLDSEVRVAYNTKESFPFLVNLLTFWVKPNLSLIADGTKLISITNGTQSVDLLRNGEDFQLSGEQEVLDFAKVYKNNLFGEEVGGSIPLEDNQWAFVSIEMPFPLNNNSIYGDVVLYPGSVYQNIGASKVTVRGLAASSIIRTYADLNAAPDYGYWTGFEFTYRELLSSENSFEYPIGPGEIFEIFTGNNNFVIEDNKDLVLQNTKGSTYLDVAWVTYNRQPS